MRDKPTHDEIVELMAETIIELADGIKSRPSSRRDFELTLQSSGFQILEVEDEAKTVAA